MTVTRRALLSYAALIGLPQVVIRTAAEAQTGTVRMRQNIQAFSQDPQKVAALRAGVGKMKARAQANPDDPLGWYYWSAVHGTLDDPGSLSKVYNQCEHTRFKPNPLRPAAVAEHFISWHRPFLFFFEATLKRAAQEAGATTAFELPYWNWYEDDDVPNIFTEGSDATNPLRHPRVNESVNSGALSRSPFDQKVLLPPSPSNWRKCFSIPLELDPHGAVHNLIGGDMGNILASARDPVFWVHHANIDRLWTVWNKTAGHANPSDAGWKQKTFTYDQTGDMRQTAGAVLDSQGSLGYRYDDETPLTAFQPAVVAAATIQSEAPMPMPGPTANSAMATVAAANPVTLGASSVAVDLKLPQSAQTQLHSLTTTGAPAGPGAITSAWLVLENVEIGADGRNGGFSFNILATLPDGQQGSRQVKVGQLGTFTWPSDDGSHGAHGGNLAPVTLTIPLKDVLSELGLSSSQELANGLRVVFQAQHKEKPGEPPKQFVKVGSISIRTSTAPLQ
jgi:tyrosinase